MSEILEPTKYWAERMVKVVCYKGSMKTSILAPYIDYAITTEMKDMESWIFINENPWYNTEIIIVVVAIVWTLFGICSLPANDAVAVCLQISQINKMLNQSQDNFGKSFDFQLVKWRSTTSAHQAKPSLPFEPMHQCTRIISNAGGKLIEIFRFCCSKMCWYHDISKWQRYG